MNTLDAIAQFRAESQGRVTDVVVACKSTRIDGVSYIVRLVDFDYVFLVSARRLLRLRADGTKPIFEASLCEEIVLPATEHSRDPYDIRDEGFSFHAVALSDMLRVNPESVVSSVRFYSRSPTGHDVSAVCIELASGVFIVLDADSVHGMDVTLVGDKSRSKCSLLAEVAVFESPSNG